MSSRGPGLDEQAFERLAAELGSSARSPAAIRRRVEVLETVLERSIKLPLKVPFVGDRIGLDAVLGLFPVAGDVIGGLMSSYLIWEARNLGMPKWKLWRMAGNTVFDTLLGFIPLVGDAADVVFRSNTKNLRIVRRHLDKHHPETAVIEGETLPPSGGRPAR